jgi:hypothetical protein
VSTHPEAVDVGRAGAESDDFPPTSALDVLVAELLGAVPEVRDALLSAADSLLDAARALVDAGDRALCRQHGEAEERPEEPAGEPG